MHAAAFEFVRACRYRYVPSGLVYEIGSRDINGSVRSLFTGLPYLGIDLVPGRGVDIVGDALYYTPPTPPTTVVCCEVLEHSPNADALLRQAADVLQSGGVLIVTTADTERAPHSAVDGGALPPGEFYENLTAARVLTVCQRHWIQGIALEADGQDIRFMGQKEG
jgi:hypothetical protein